MALTPPRSLQERRHDTFKRLENDMDVWVSTAAADGVPYLVPLSFLWVDDTFLVSTTEKSPTARNLAPGRTVRLALGTTRDVVLAEGTSEQPAPGELDDLADAFARRTGWDPRAEDTPYRYFRIRPRRVQAWREVNELAGRDLMRGGVWLE